MDIREQIEWWKRQEQRGCVDSCPYWSELEGFLFNVEKLLAVYEAAKVHSDAIDQGFVSEVRPDIARMLLNRALDAVQTIQKEKPYMDPNPSIEYWCDACNTYHDHGEHTVPETQNSQKS